MKTLASANPLGEEDPLLDRLKNLRLPFVQNHCRPWAVEAAQKSWAHLDYLSKLYRCA